MVIKVSERESLNCRIKENIQKIELFKLINDKYGEITINHLKKENIRLKNMLKKLNRGIMGNSSD